MSSKTFHIGNTVRVWLPDGTIVLGTVKRVNWSMVSGRIPTAEYYIALHRDGFSSWFDEAVVYGYENPDSKCECGSETLGHPGHSFWCNKFKEYA